MHIPSKPNYLLVTYTHKHTQLAAFHQAEALIMKYSQAVMLRFLSDLRSNKCKDKGNLELT